MTVLVEDIWYGQIRGEQIKPFLTAILHRGLRIDFFIQVLSTFSIFDLDFPCLFGFIFPFLFGLFFPFSIWTFISLVYSDFVSLSYSFFLFIPSRSIILDFFQKNFVRGKIIQFFLPKYCTYWVDCEMLTVWKL